MPFDLKKQLVFYGAYHREPTNIAIHITCVPVLLATAFIFGTNTPSLPLPLPRLLSRLHLPLNLSTLAGTTYATLYLLLSPNLAGLTIAPLVLALSSLSNRLHARAASSLPPAVRKLNAVAAAVHVASWIAQFVGHGKFEGRKPALLDNLVQALFLAPLFVWYEVLFKLGLYKRLRAEVEAGIEAEVSKMKAGGKE
ncbi:DUF962-domain-containing protein [Melanomma pulvis-pyrius CBS 109.77]|uniref:DUF962-domain-containing protein n=1 Tax=Melanomma pulvis-pyrius CBS 109.77 TaxID=1314802 RepID=A0A6A6X997_9PLEO|nr:DUF962-domain-containing protein [Melanomma pulvis-pyrius CBS 109.77]